MPNFLLTTFFIFYSLPLFAGEPDWVYKTPETDGNYKYYVGRSAPLSTDEAAYSAADKNAREQAVKHNFGSTFKIQSTQTDSFTSSNSISRSEELSKKVNLSGFELVSDHLQVSGDDDNKKYIRYILYKYSIKEIDIEKNRLSKIGADTQTNFSDAGSDADCLGVNNTEIQIIATESSSKVVINGEMIGFTPLKIKCKYPAGVPLKLQLDHKKYELFNDQVVPIQGDVTKVMALLTPAFVKLIINTNPTGATIKINGESVGISSTSEVSVQAGVPLQIMIEHPEADKILQEFEVDKSQPIVRRNFNLPLKPAYLSVQSSPEGADVLIDNDSSAKLVTPTGFKPCEAGKHILTLKKEGFKTFQTEVLCIGGQKILTNQFVLAPYSGPENTIEINLGFSTSTFSGIDMSFGKISADYTFKPFSYIGFMAGLSILAGQQKFDNATLGGNGKKVTIGLPIFFLQDSSDGTTAELRPELGYSSYTFKSAYTNGATVSTTSKNQLSYGATVSYRYLVRNQFYITPRLGFYLNNDSNDIAGKANTVFSIGVPLAW